MRVGGFELANQEKVTRALEGVVTGSGNHVGGIAREDGSYDDDALLAEYDRLGGLIRKGTDKVKTGSFYDFKAKKPRTKPQVSFIFRVNGKEVEVPDGAELPGIVKAARILAADEAEDEAEETPKLKKKKK
mgnify:CR=1 FL=1